MDEGRVVHFDFSSYKPGFTWTPMYTVFRVYSPNASSVQIELWPEFTAPESQRFPLEKSNTGYWEARIHGNWEHYWYAYHIIPPNPCPPTMEPYRGPISDPWSKHVGSYNNYKQEAKTLIEGVEYFDWEGDRCLQIEDPRDLIIYEAHLKDFTAHPSAGVNHAGTYRGFLEAKDRGGISYLKKLGINAVEFLPLQKAARFEPPYLETISSGISNTWNYYGRNHWGYMTSHFFVPETLYASGQSQDLGAISGLDNRARQEFKNLVKALHKEGIAVIMDVVYNHVSEYDLNPLRYSSKEDYFRLDDAFDYISQSGCGNDSKTEHPIFQDLIVESVCHWIEEYHIDGFRFDLANLIDWSTIDRITVEARKRNPNVLLISEPWGGGYNPIEFSKRGWIAWNDQIRNGVKGSDPIHNRGFIFGDWQHETNRNSIENFLRGSLLGFSNGNFESSKTSLNYLESHDGHTLGDFIRLGLSRPLSTEKSDRETIVKLNAQEERIARLGAVFLLLSQGVCMIHQGQEFARTKWIYPDPVNDPRSGFLDHNSYEKDNATNYINYDDLDQNIGLFEYYRGLIEIRKSSPALRKSEPHALHFWANSDPLVISMFIDGHSVNDAYNYVIGLNGNNFLSHEIELPDGFWEIIVTDQYASNKTLAKISGRVILPPASGYVLRQWRS
jgi:pullulanase/glycogen debranching enzyme